MGMKNTALPERKDVPAEYKWHIEDIFETNEAFEAELAAFSEDVKALGSYQGHLGDSPEKLLEYLELKEALMIRADSLGAYAAHKYADAADTWMDAITLAQELGTDYRTLLASIGKDQFAEVNDGSGNLRIAYIAEIAPEGKPAPVEYVTERIRDIILSNRKHKLETDLEQDLLEDAIRNQKFVIY